VSKIKLNKIKIILCTKSINFITFSMFLVKKNLDCIDELYIYENVNLHILLWSPYLQCLSLALLAIKIVMYEICSWLFFYHFNLG
jgi:hypothetical protein